ncbi:MAG: hypothetical protein NXI00_10965 [Cytophagales bacterium]|nr:hypothetical protein [Cytophagales bacterium]
MLELIQSWLKNKDYALGVELYRRFGSSAYLKILFSKGPDTYNSAKLEAEMKGLLSVTEPAKQQPLAKEYVAQKKDILPSEASDAPAEIKSAISKRKSLYAQVRVNRDKLSDAYLTDNESGLDLNMLAHEILNAWDGIRDCWELTNFYDKYQRLPEKVQNETDYDTWPTDVLNKTFLNNYKYIKKYLHNIKKREAVIERINASLAIKSTLQKKDAFFHQTLTIPSASELDSRTEETEIVD